MTYVSDLVDWMGIGRSQVHTGLTNTNNFVFISGERASDGENPQDVFISGKRMGLITRDYAYEDLTVRPSGNGIRTKIAHKHNNLETSQRIGVIGGGGGSGETQTPTVESYEIFSSGASIRHDSGYNHDEGRGLGCAGGCYIYSATNRVADPNNFFVYAISEDASRSGIAPDGVDDGDNANTVAWSTGGDHVAFVVDGTHKLELYHIEEDGSDINMTEEEMPTTYYGPDSFDLSNDGEYLLVQDGGDTTIYDKASGWEPMFEHDGEGRPGKLSQFGYYMRGGDQIFTTSDNGYIDDLDRQNDNDHTFGASDDIDWSNTFTKWHPNEEIFISVDYGYSDEFDVGEYVLSAHRIEDDSVTLIESLNLTDHSDDWDEVPGTFRGTDLYYGGSGVGWRMVIQTTGRLRRFEFDDYLTELEGILNEASSPEVIKSERQHLVLDQ